MPDRYSIFNPNYITNILNYRNIKAYLEYFNGVLLDIGCGEFPYAELLKGKISHCLGLDIDLSSLREKSSPQKVAVYAKGEMLPFKNNSFDTILCAELLEHVPEPDLIMQEIRRVLKSSGYLILSVPQVWYIHGQPYDFHRFTKFGIEYLMRKNNFDLVRIERRGNFWLMFAQILNYYIEYSFSKSSAEYLTFWGIIHKIIEKMRKYIFAFNYCFFSVLDKIDKHKLDTLGYTVVAKKRSIWK